MELHDIVTNDYIQLLVTVSSILTLGLLLVQAHHYLIRPVYSFLINGYSRSRKLAREKFAAEILAAGQNSRNLIVSIFGRVLFVFLALFSMINSIGITTIAAIMYVPGYGVGSGIGLITAGMSPKGAAITALTMSSISLVFMVLSTLSMAKFLHAVRPKIV